MKCYAASVICPANSMCSSRITKAMRLLTPPAPGSFRSLPLLPKAFRAPISIAQLRNRSSARAKTDGVKVRGYISCVLGCPFDGEIKPKAVADVAKTLWDLGCYEISLGDTIGVGTPTKAKEMLRAVGAHVPLRSLAMHFHDTYGQALVNLYAGIEEGVHVIDSAAGGLGGCPFAPGATGNVATEDVVYMLEGMGIRTGVDMQKLLAATNEITRLIGRPPASRVANALNAKRKRTAL